MTRPGRRLRLMFLCLIVFLAMVAGINWLADPYGVWRIALVDQVYLNSQPGERVLTPYRVRFERPTTILVGSSRTLWGMPIEQGYRDGILNASLPGSSLDELAAIVHVALRNPQLKRLVWGVDFFTFDENWTDFRDAETRLRLEGNLGLLLTDTLLNTEALAASRKLLVRAVAGRTRLPPTRVALLPWPQETIAEAFESSQREGLAHATAASVKEQLAGWVSKYKTFRLSARHVALFRDTLTHAKAAGVEVILFIGPMSAYELEAIGDDGQWDTFEQWKRQLATIAPYWDFSGYNPLAYADDAFLDVVHFKAAPGHLILRHLLGQDTSRCGTSTRLVLDSGVWVDAATVEQHLVKQGAARRAAERPDSRYHMMVADILRQ